MKTACKRKRLHEIFAFFSSFQRNCLLFIIFVISEAGGVEVSPSVVVANTNSGLPWHHVLKTWLNVVPSQRMPFFDLE